MINRKLRWCFLISKISGSARNTSDWLRQKYVGLARLASPFLRYFWPRSPDKLDIQNTNMVFSLSPDRPRNTWVLFGHTEVIMPNVFTNSHVEFQSVTTSPWLDYSQNPTDGSAGLVYMRTWITTDGLPVHDHAAFITG